MEVRCEHNCFLCSSEYLGRCLGVRYGTDVSLTGLPICEGYRYLGTPRHLKEIELAESLGKTYLDKDFIIEKLGVEDEEHDKVEIKEQGEVENEEQGKADVDETADDIKDYKVMWDKLKEIVEDRRKSAECGEMISIAASVFRENECKSILDCMRELEG